MSEAHTTEDTAGGNAEVADHPESNRYEVHVDGALAGFADYQRGPGQIAFTHTEVDSAFSGRGLAGRLARKALDDAKAAGNEVLPFCPFFRGFIAKHPEYLELVPVDRRSEFDL
ncbi:N-acetyltransferase [Actinospica durhamensis]|uniref:N-acetyltransferase n=1 Tax=Actinospica durhamensis TaxID=1508375 RepID=A0A941ITU4_9ACTN|nr:GNAT family N-acetyltransferase [Actinospica durhamensis]MBR7836428.1 N-acetyltransferase [Actinospica durhamensis]